MPSKRACVCVLLILLVFAVFITTLYIIHFYSRVTKHDVSILKQKASFSYHRMKRQQHNACSDYSQIIEFSQIKFRDKYKMDQPWPRSSKLFVSENLVYNWNWIRENKIRGLRIPLSNVIRMYDNNKCLFMPWDSAVRNILLSAEPIPISAELSCSLARIYSLCKIRFGKSTCHRLPNTSYVLLGDPFDTRSSLGEILNEPLRLYSWKTFSGRASHELDYTVNALGLYDDLAGKLFLIDSTGKGFTDACGKKIRSIQEPLNGLGSWNQGNTFYKALRMYDLLSYDLISTDEQQEFVKREVKRLFYPEKFERFYCENICEGFFIPAHSDRETSPFCYLGLQRHNDMSKRINKFKAALRSDFQNSLYSQMEASIGSIRHVNGKLPSSSIDQQSDDRITAKFEDHDAVGGADATISDTRTENAFIVVRQAGPSTNTPTTSRTSTNAATMIMKTSAAETFVVTSTSSSSTSTSPQITTFVATNTLPTTSQTPKTTNSGSITTRTIPKPPLTKTRSTLTDDDFKVIYYTFSTYKYYHVITPGPHVDFSWKK